MIKFSYIVPSICKFNKLSEQLSSIGNKESISEIIIINNSNGLQLPEISTTAPIIEIIPKEPSFCNGAWNLGVEMASSDYIILATDDLIFDANVLDMIANGISHIKNLGVIGIDCNIISNQNKQLENIWFEVAPTQREYGFGLMMFMKRIDFNTIPYNIRHWYGDDYIYYTMLEKGLINYFLKSSTFEINTEIGSMSSNEITKKRIEIDREYWMNNL